MEIKLEISITDKGTRINLADNQGVIEITDVASSDINQLTAIYLLVSNRQIVDIGKEFTEGIMMSKKVDRVIKIVAPWDIQVEHLEMLLFRTTLENGLILADPKKVEKKIPSTAIKSITPYLEKLIKILATFGYVMTPVETVAPTKKKAGKAQHRWSKEVSQIEFFVNSRESKASIMWQKRNEMLIKKGAEMKPVATLNKDGSIGFAARLGDKIRSDHQLQFDNFVTTEDIILKSVNEVGLFLYFGGANGWLEMSDSNGKTINDWTVIE